MDNCMNEPAAPEMGAAVPRVKHEGGRRLVSWPVVLTDGEITFQHDFPDALTHHYTPGGVNEDVLLYEGSFRLPGDPRPYEGDVRWRWNAVPRIEARGWRPSHVSDLERFFGPSAMTPGLWVDPDELDLDLVDGVLPSQPRQALRGEPAPRLSSIQANVEQQVGDPSALDRVTFLIPNGWRGDGHGICDATDLTRIWHGRTEATGDGWALTFDLRQEMSGEKPWKELGYRRGQQFTHVGELRRLDGSRFSGEQAFATLDRVRLALNLALGRRVTCSLPVGYLEGAPVWSRWRSAPIDWYRDKTHWLDSTISSQQVSDVLGLVLDFSSEPSKLAALKSSLSYYVSSNVDVDVELTVSLPVSGLQLLSYYRFVAQKGAYSQGKWNKMDTERQIRLLLDDIGLDLAVPTHFEHLEAVRQRTSNADVIRDALGAVMKMRNVVTHPTRDLPDNFSIYEWAEAGMQARYWFCLALLNTVGYKGQVARILEAQPRWQGQVTTPPWVQAAESPDP